MTIAKINEVLYLICTGITKPIAGAFDVKPQKGDIDAVGHPVIEQRLDLRGGRTALRAREHVGVDLERNMRRGKSR
jgi:hypothetical protein